VSTDERKVKPPQSTNEPVPEVLTSDVFNIFLRKYMKNAGNYSDGNFARVIGFINSLPPEDGPITQPTPEEPEIAPINHEILNDTTLLLRVSFHGKIFYYDGGISESKSEEGCFYGGMRTSPYANRNILTNDFLPANFVSKRPRILGLLHDNNNQNALVQIDAHWMTEADYAMEKNIEGHGLSRPFPNTVATWIGQKSEKEIVDLLSRGYGVLSALFSRGNIIRLMGSDKKIRVKKHNRNFQGENEVITVRGNEANLWDNGELLKSDAFVAGIADAYLKLIEEKNVLVVSPNKDDTEMRILIAQALCQMIAVKDNRLLRWVSEVDAFDPREYQHDADLEFTNRSNVINITNDPNVYNSEIVDLEKSHITDQNRQVVEDIRAAFRLPMPRAMREWTRLQG
jgi:hypothetical protein